MPGFEHAGTKLVVGILATSSRFWTAAVDIRNGLTTVIMTFM